MTIVPGKVVNGRIEVEDTELPEGADVAVYYKPDVEEYELTEEQEAELEASIAEADRGETVPWEEVRRELQEQRENATKRYK
ncbi:MAG TPA: hypothetical protein VEK57_20010 [Thermoanaerobaculia bacterium]|nr:hypothetical protein [Thermoanaerobaculia bacterium]